jgi:hypothetical protein
LPEHKRELAGAFVQTVALPHNHATTFACLLAHKLSLSIAVQGVNEPPGVLPSLYAGGAGEGAFFRSNPFAAHTSPKALPAACADQLFENAVARIFEQCSRPAVDCSVWRAHPIGPAFQQLAEQLARIAFHAEFGFIQDSSLDETFAPHLR